MNNMSLLVFQIQKAFLNLRPTCLRDQRAMTKASARERENCLRGEEINPSPTLAGY